MSELRRDPITGRWNIINTHEPLGPGDFEVEHHETSGAVCPFCAGNERLTPPEISALGHQAVSRTVLAGSFGSCRISFPRCGLKGNSAGEAWASSISPTASGLMKW